MHLARLRRFAWMLVLVLTAGLAAPAFASLSEPLHDRFDVVTHVHADSSVHAHPIGLSDTGSVTAAGMQPAKAPRYCPGSVTAAECAVSCFGVAVLPASVPTILRAMPGDWTPSLLDTPAGVSPFGDIDPPRPVSVR